MLVCSVSQSQRRAAITADLAEAAIALDAPGTGNVVFATLVDDPASVRDRVDAFLGQIMREAASAAATVNAGFAKAVTIAEAAAAVSTQDATAGAGIVPATWDPATISQVTLSGGNLVATNTGTTGTNHGARTLAAAGKTTGKFYFELTYTAITAGPNVGGGIATTASSYFGMGNQGAVTGVELYVVAGAIWAGGSDTGINLGARVGGDVIGVAVDLVNKSTWFKKVSGTPGNWNGSGTANPATNVGGISTPAGTLTPILTFGGTGGLANNVVAANFGASAFTGAVPSGFTAGWPA
jgi:hypothetical protein